MKTNQPIRLTVLAAAFLILSVNFGGRAADEPPIDWNRARQLNQRDRQGEQLSAEDRAYLERARKLRAAGAREARPPGNERAARNQPAQPVRHFTPLTELAGERYRDEDGGLYGGGQSEPPAGHQAAARKEAAKIHPLDATGNPSDSGQVVLLSIGMSNTTQEFSQFKRLADADSEKSASLVIVDGAQGGQDAVRTQDESTAFWRNIDDRLKSAGVTPAQVQVIWLKQAIAGPRQGFPDEARRLQDLLGKIVHIAKKRYPNLRIAYLSSRIYAGYATSQLNPEPYAYESAFAVRWLIQDQIKGNPKLNFDPARGDAPAPLLLWGPYLWGDGLTPRKSDGFVWKQEDFAGDGTHPSPAGRQKVAELLLKFFKMDANARTWFLQQK